LQGVRDFFLPLSKVLGGVGTLFQKGSDLPEAKSAIDYGLAESAIDFVSDGQKPFREKVSGLPKAFYHRLF